MINQAAARRMGMDDPVGQVIAIGKETAPILGVLEDFHFQSLHHPIQPLFILHARQGDHVDIRLDATQRGRLLPLIEQAFRRHYPELPYAPRWLDEQLAKSYAAEQQLERILAVFALVALGLSCLGLFGLASYTLERRKKEVSIRKVLGRQYGANGPSVSLGVCSQSFIRLCPGLAIGGHLYGPVDSAIRHPAALSLVGFASSRGTGAGRGAFNRFGAGAHDFGTQPN